MSLFRRVYVTDETTGDTATVNAEGRFDVTQHAHIDSGTVHFHVAGLTASQDFILLDFSDTTNYPHTATGYVHLERVEIHTTGNGSAIYEITLGFLDGVDGTDGDFYPLFKVLGTNTAGRSNTETSETYPNGPRCTPAYVACSGVSLNDTAFQTDVNLASTLDPATADTPSGTGDLVLRVTVSAGTVDVHVLLAYHSHA